MSTVEGATAPSYCIHKFFVHGTPEQQGSTRAFVVKGRAHITTTNKNLSSWRERVAAVANDHACMHTYAVRVECMFYMPKPTSAPKKRIPMIKRPDLDKLARALLDALTGVMFRDDCQVMSLQASKVYAESGEPIGVDVRIIAEPEPPRRRTQTIKGTL